MATVRDYMTVELVVLAPEMSVHEARRLFVQRRVSGAPVIDAKGAVVGMLTGRDLLEAFARASYFQDPSDRVEHCMSHRVQTIDADADIVQTVDLFLRSRYRRCPVLEGARLVGILSRHDILRAFEKLW